MRTTDPIALARLQDLATRLKSAPRITVLTGAGVSAASGVPTFRGDDGLWRSYRPEQLATPEAFRRDPRLVSEWYEWRRTAIASCAPNAAHQVLARWGEREGVTLITQNVDGLHERAGSRDVVRFHGSIWYVRCSRPCAAGGSDWEDRAVPWASLPPACPHCGAHVRPAVVWFGEPIAAEVIARALDAARCDVFLSVGTSSVVYPAAGLIGAASAHDAFTAEINPDATEATPLVDLSLRMPAELALPMLDELMTR